jgi:hypothetical protein
MGTSTAGSASVKTVSPLRPLPLAGARQDEKTIGNLSEFLDE